MSKVLRPAARQRFILDYLRQRGEHFLETVNILDTGFVDAYTEATGAPHDVMPFGANRCKMLGRDLSAMYKAGLLERDTDGIFAGEWGMPRWVYTYSLIERNTP